MPEREFKHHYSEANRLMPYLVHEFVFGTGIGENSFHGRGLAPCLLKVVRKSEDLGVLLLIRSSDVNDKVRQRGLSYSRHGPQQQTM